MGLLLLAGCQHPQARIPGSNATVEYNAQRSYAMCLDVIAHNIANASTTGYKRCRVEFPERVGSPVGQTDPGKSQRMQLGAQTVSVRRIFANGKIVFTGEHLDIAIVGDGFFEVQRADGSRAFTRDGSFSLSPDGHVTTRDGLTVCGGFVPIAQGTTSLGIGANGMVVCNSAEGTQYFQVQLRRFPNPSALEAVSDNLFLETSGSNGAEIGNPGKNGFGTLAQGYLESSNVNIDEEMFELIRVRNACKVLGKVAKARQN